VEAPTMRVNPGDTISLDVLNRIQPPTNSTTMKMEMPASTTTCGDGGAMTISSTNVHFHGLNVPPVCHQDDIINTLIQPGTPGFQYNVQIPTTEPPGLYWYHPHVHGFTEFQVNGGAAGAIVVEGMEKFRPEVTGLTERIFVIRQQYLVPWIPGPYQLTINYQTAPVLGIEPIIQMAPGEKQFWRVANATLQDFIPLSVIVNGVAQPLEIIALDGYPLAQTRNETSILIPPAGRAEFIVQAPASGQTATLSTAAYSTGPTGNADLAQTLASIQLTGTSSSQVAKTAAAKSDAVKTEPVKTEAAKTESAPINKPVKTASIDSLKFSDLAHATVTAQRQIYFSEEFGGTNGPIQFYITVAGQKQQVFQANEPPAITTKVGAVEDWTIENRALETHAFHIHQIHFQVLEIDGQAAADNDLRDTIEIPYWGGAGTPYHSVKVRMDFRDPTTAGEFVFHCHILLHEDLGMMHKILVQSN
jgi:FtsP/CotA-like multicopper oxidase with cupredoxin domain